MLERLGTDRIDRSTNIVSTRPSASKTSPGTVAELIGAGKVGDFGLSEVSAATIPANMVEGPSTTSRGGVITPWHHAAQPSS
jgi:aryl-alcohol dehydrogenase-like predicted oxidoreductase